MYKVTLKPSPEDYNLEGLRLPLYFDDIPTLDALYYAVGEELRDTKDHLFRRNCLRLVLEIGLPRLGSYESNTVISLRGELSLSRLRVYKAT